MFHVRFGDYREHRFTIDGCPKNGIEAVDWRVRHGLPAAPTNKVRLELCTKFGEPIVSETVCRTFAKYMDADADLIVPYCGSMALPPEPVAAFLSDRSNDDNIIKLVGAMIEAYEKERSRELSVLKDLAKRIIDSDNPVEVIKEVDVPYYDMQTGKKLLSMAHDDEDVKQANARLRKWYDEMDRRKEEERAKEAEERQRMVDSYVVCLPLSENQRERYAAGLLPRNELLSIVREAEFSCCDFPEREKFTKENLPPCTCGVQDDSEPPLLTFERRDSCSAKEWELVKALRAKFSHTKADIYPIRVTGSLCGADNVCSCRDVDAIRVVIDTPVGRVTKDYVVES